MTARLTVVELDEEVPLAASDRASRPRRSLQSAIFSLPITGFLVTGWAHRWITEDGFIYLRIVHQVGAGHGPGFNIGQRVEAYTGTLWVGILALADLLTPIRLEWLAVLLGLGIGAAGVTLAMAGARRLWSPAPDSALFIPFGAVVFVAILPVWVYATSGLETSLAFGWLGLCLWILSGWARTPETRLSTWGAVVLGLGWLIRPELVIFSTAFFALVVVLEPREGARRARLRIACGLLALPVAYQIFRMGYFGSLVPNTAIAKEGSSANWSRGWTYFRDFVDPYWLWVPAVLMLGGGYLPFALASARRTRARWVVGTFLACGVLQATYVVAVGGDYAHARLLLPGYFAICAPVAAIPATRRHLAALLVTPWAFAAVLTLRPDQYTSGNLFAHLIVMPPKQDLGKVTTSDWGWGPGGQYNRWFSGPAYYYQTSSGLRIVRVDIPVANDVHLPIGAFFGIGISAYAAGDQFNILDLEGLADTFTAHLESTPSMSAIPRFPGHEKPLPAPWIAARLTPPGSRPAAVDFPVLGNGLIPATTGVQFQVQVAWARAALKCGGIQRILDAADAPMSPKRFASNLLHSFSNTRTRIPADPETAYRKFCGTDIPPEVQSLLSR